MKFKKLILILIIIAIIGVVAVFAIKGGTSDKPDNGKINVVVTNFAAYDFVRQTVGDNANITNLLKPGVEMHSYDPSPSDLAVIENSDIFIYVGGEAENWVEAVLESIDTSDTKLLKLMDTVTVIEETEIEGAEEEEEEEEGVAFDEHIWTSPANAIKIMESIEAELSKIDSENSKSYEENANAYISKIRDVQAKTKTIVDSKVRNRLVFGDRMPMQYFLNEFGLEVSAAFMGCSTETEPSSATIAFLVDKVKEEKIPVVLYIELGNEKVANVIADETGAEVMQIQSFHNVTAEDFNNGETYVSLMTRNLDVLKKALQ